MNQNNKSFIKTVVIVIIVVVIGVVGYFALNKKSEVPDFNLNNQNPTSTTPIVSTTTQAVTWKTYRNTEYNFSMKYPSDWEQMDFQGVGMGTLDTFGFIPVTLKNLYCNIEREASFLVQNYKTWNPFPGYEQYALNLAKVDNCSIQIRVEKNPEKLNTKDYLRKVYLPFANSAFASNSPDNTAKMEKNINDLVVVKDNGVEKSWNNYAFDKYMGGMDGTELMMVNSDSNQVIINTGKNILFITSFTRYSNSVRDQKNLEDLFEKIALSFQVL